MLRLLLPALLLSLSAAHGGPQGARQGALELVLDAGGRAHYFDGDEREVGEGAGEDEDVAAMPALIDEGVAAMPALIRRQDPYLPMEDRREPQQGPIPAQQGPVPVDGGSQEGGSETGEGVRYKSRSAMVPVAPTPAPPVIALVNITEQEMMLQADKRKVSGEASAACAALLLGTIAFALLLYYMVNVSDENLVASTWELIARMVSMFVVLHLFMALKATLYTIMKHKANTMTDSEKIKEIIIGVARFVVLFIVMPITLRALKGYKMRMAMFTMFFAHMLGFSTADTATCILGMDHYAKSIPAYMGGFSILIIAMCLIIAITGYVRNMIKPADVDGEMWDLACEHAENEGYGLFLGFIISMTTRFVITKHVPPLHGDPQGRTASECKQLGIAVGVSFFLYAFCAMSKAKEREYAPTPRRFSQLTRMTLAMYFGWNLLYWLQWVFWIKMKPVEPINVLLAYVVMALTTSAVVIVMMVLLNCISGRAGEYDSAWRSIMIPFMLTVAFAWNEVFRHTILNLARFCLARGYTGPQGQIKGHDLSFERYQIMLLFGMVLFVCPAWCCCIFNKADEIRPIFPEIYPDDYQDRKDKEDNEDVDDDTAPVKELGAQEEQMATAEQMAAINANAAQWAQHSMVQQQQQQMMMAAQMPPPEDGQGPPVFVNDS